MSGLIDVEVALVMAPVVAPVVALEATVEGAVNGAFEPCLQWHLEQFAKAWDSVA